MRKLLATAAMAALVPATVSAQERVSLWDLLSVDRFVQSFVQSGIMMLRTQMDLTYGDLTVDLRRSRVTLTDIKAWPFFDWDVDLACEIDIDRIALIMSPVDQIERYKFKARVTGMTMAPECLPEEAQEGLAVAGLTEVTIPRATIDVDYGVPASDMLARIYAEVSDVATIDLAGDFSYFWFDGRYDLEEPDPVWFLRSATLSVENHGIWEAVRDELPPFLTDPAAVGTVEGFLREGLMEMVREGDPDATALLPEQEDFIQAFRETWPQFLENPETIVLETGIEGDTYIDVYLIEDEPAELFPMLMPTISLKPRRITDALPADLLRSAIGDGDLSDDDSFTVGKALITGVGAPRSVEEGMKLLTPLAEAGNAEAALLVADTLAATDSHSAYTWALRAGASGAAGATAILDRLEQSMDFATVLQLQDELSGTDSHPGSALRSVSGIREQASMRLSGNGLARSYGIAAMWAMLAKAAGDPEASDILEEIDEIVRLEGNAAAKAWAETEAEYARLAMEVWIGQNLPARYAE